MLTSLLFRRRICVSHSFYSEDALVVGHIVPRDVYNASEILPGPTYTGNATDIALSAQSQSNQTVDAMPLQWPTAPYQQLDQSSSSLPIGFEHNTSTQVNAGLPPGMHIIMYHELTKTYKLSGQLQGKAFVTLQSEAGGIVIFRVSQEVAAMLIQHQRFIENHV